MTEDFFFTCVFCGKKIEDVPIFIIDGQKGYNFCDLKHLQLWQKNNLNSLTKISREEIENDFQQVIKSLPEMYLINLLQLAYRFNYSETLFVEQYTNEDYPDVNTLTMKVIHEKSYSADGSLEVCK